MSSAKRGSAKVCKTDREGTFAGTRRNDKVAPRIGIGGHLLAPPLPHHRAYGSVPRRFDRLSVGRNVEARKTETVEIRVAQSLLDGRMSGHAPETGRRAGSNRRVELWQATLSQFFEAVGAVLPLPPEVRS